MLKRRGSFKVAPGVRLNYGRRGFTSVNVAGVRLGSSRRSGGRRSGPTKTELLGKHWRLRPGIFSVRIEVNDVDSINLVVDGGELTYRRMKRIMDARYDGDAEAVARAFKAFVRRWDMLEDDGSTPMPITKRAVERLGVEMIFGLAVEAANALEIPQKPLGHVITDRKTGKPPRVSVSTMPPTSSSKSATSSLATPLGSTSTQAAPVTSAGGTKSTTVAYLVWLLLGLIGGHRYYLGRYGTAFLMTITIGGLGVWWLIDVFLIRSMIQHQQNEL